MKSHTFLVLIFLGAVCCQDLKSLLDICANPPKIPPKTLSDKIVLPAVYKVSGSITDFMTSVTSLLVETATSEFVVLEKNSRDQLPERWIQELTGDKHITFVNVTAGSCNGTAPKPQLFNIPRFDNIIGNNTSSFAEIINGLITFDKSHSGFLTEDSEIVGGVITNKWVSCVNGTNANETNVIVEVRYTTEDAIRPASSGFSNPLLLSIRLVEVPKFINSTITSHVSIELDRFELPDNNGAVIEHGIECAERNRSSLPIKQIDEFAALVTYFDHVTNTSENTEIFYSKKRQILIIGGHEMQHGVSILGVGPNMYKNGTDYIIHDFKYGYEFTMRHGACDTFRALPEMTNDVSKERNDTLIMKDIGIILIDTGLVFAKYQSDVDLAGIPRQTYRALNAREEKVVEAHFTDDGNIISVSTFRMGSRHLVGTMTVSQLPVESSRLNYRIAQMSDCYDGGKFANNTWIVDISNKNVTDLTSVGLNALNEAVTESLSKNVHAIIPYRVLVFWVEKTDGGVSIIFRLSEKTDTQPAKVGYNLADELSTLDMFTKINETLFLEKMPIEVEKSDGTKEEWMLNKKTMKLYPDENDTGFIGYTGGAMFVLAVFCLLIGVSIGAVGVFVATRRQRISTLAYQVFE